MPDGIWVRWTPGSGAGPSRQTEEVSLSASGENSSSSYSISLCFISQAVCRLTPSLRPSSIELIPFLLWVKW